MGILHEETIVQGELLIYWGALSMEMPAPETRKP